MKKLFYLLFLLPVAFMASCNSDDLPSADLTLTLGGVTQDDGYFYTVAGNEISIEDITVKALSGKNAGVTNVIFYFEGYPLIGNPGNPFEGVISTEGLKAGTYSLSMSGNLVEEDKTLSTFGITFYIKIVESEEDLPAGAPEIGTYSATVRLGEDNSK